MVQVIQGQNVTLAYLKEKFALRKSEDEQFFTEWFDNLSTLSDIFIGNEWGRFPIFEPAQTK